MFALLDQKLQTRQRHRAQPGSLLKIVALAMASLFALAPVHAQDEPPGRVARVSYAYGDIGFADAGSNNWTSLIPNRPLSTGDSLQVPYAGKAELHVGANALRMQENSRISFSLLNDDNTQIDMAQGSMVLKIRTLSNRENFDVRTPNLVFSIQEPGEYRININSDNTTTVMVRRGTAIARGERDTITIRQGEQSRFAGSNLQHTQINGIPPFDTFDLWAADRDRAEENVETARYVSREVIGYEQLDGYGAWETTTDFGPVWYPSQVNVTWAPYRDGNWVWVAPWGWTWVDRAPWGFAPYHYGRWAYIGTRWAWVPGTYHQHIRPVYAPALVAFVGDGQYIANGRGNHNHAYVGWFPLGPGEAYRPGYSSNQYYIQRLNQNIVVNNIVVNNRYAYQNNQRAWTVVPTQAFVRGEHITPITNTKLIFQNNHAPQIATVAPNITPASNNRFGDARQNNLNNGEQFRQRNQVIAPTRPEQAGINNVNSFNNNAVIVNRPATSIVPAPSNGPISANPPAGFVSRQPSNVAPVQALVPSPANPNNVVNRVPDNTAYPQRPNNVVPNNVAPNNANNNSFSSHLPANNVPTPAANPPTNVIIPAPANNGYNASIRTPINTPTANAPVNNAIMNAPVNRPAERQVDNGDRTPRNNGNWNNHAQPEIRVERPAERPQQSPVVDRPAQVPLVQQPPQVIRSEPRYIPPPQVVPQPMPQPARIEIHPAPVQGPAQRQEKPREKEDPRNAKHDKNEHQ